MLLYRCLLHFGSCGLRPWAAAGVGHKLTAASASTLALGMALALLAVVWSALRAGSNTALFRLGLEDGGEAGGGALQPLVGDDEEGRAFVQARALPVQEQALVGVEVAEEVLTCLLMACRDLSHPCTWSAHLQGWTRA